MLHKKSLIKISKSVYQGKSGYISFFIQWNGAQESLKIVQCFLRYLPQRFVSVKGNVARSEKWNSDSIKQYGKHEHIHLHDDILHLCHLFKQRKVIKANSRFVLKNQSFFTLEYIQGASKYGFGLETLNQILSVHDLASWGIDQDNMLPHLGNGVLVDQMIGVFKQGHVDADHVGVLQQSIQINVFCIRYSSNPIVGRKGIVAKDLLNKSGQFFHAFLANQSGTNDTNLEKNTL